MFYLSKVLLLAVSGCLPLQVLAADWQAYQSQATAAYQAGDYQQAVEAIDKAIASADKAANGQAYKASSLNILAFIQADQGDMAAALNNMNEAVRLGKEALGRPDEHVATLLFNQGIFLQRAEQFEQALPVLQDAIDDYISLNITGDGNVWQAVLARSQILAKQSPDEAFAQIKQALSGFEQRGFSHVPEGEQAAALALLGGQIAYEQYYDQAIEILKQAASQLDQLDDPAQKTAILDLLAVSYDLAGQPEQAATVRQRVLALQAGQPANMAKVMHLNELAMRHLQNQAYGEAEQLYQQALQAIEELNQTESIEQAVILGNYASVKLAQKDNRRALALFEQSLALHQQLDQRPIEAAAVAGYVGTLYYNLRQYSEAEAAFLQAQHWLERVEQVDPQSLLTVFENLHAVYASWGRDSRARLYERKARALKTQINEKKS